MVLQYHTASGTTKTLVLLSGRPEVRILSWVPSSEIPPHGSKKAGSLRVCFFLICAPCLLLSKPDPLCRAPVLFFAVEKIAF